MKFMSLLTKLSTTFMAISSVSTMPVLTSCQKSHKPDSTAKLKHKLSKSDLSFFSETETSDYFSNFEFGVVHFNPKTYKPIEERYSAYNFYLYNLDTFKILEEMIPNISYNKENIKNDIDVNEYVGYQFGELKDSTKTEKDKKQYLVNFMTFEVSDLVEENEKKTEIKEPKYIPILIDQTDKTNAGKRSSFRVKFVSKNAEPKEFSDNLLSPKHTKLTTKIDKKTNKKYIVYTHTYSYLITGFEPAIHIGQYFFDYEFADFKSKEISPTNDFK
ncbi:hypothetical protein [Mycoplasma procyoni]|uniref:hypothetical protein n=1 Tax=Mycoplasma procyoni TaxID=568784 RepID=UPI00197BD6E5|nr:hypothetical protein [Mycoplasma procyoni]MBN3534569.1 hypothetical protein [Mycoplasma procyoni]